MFLLYRLSLGAPIGVGGPRVLPVSPYITRNMGQDGDGHAHFDQIWRPNITINYMGVDQNIIHLMSAPEGNS
jgi:hypothetical protein